MASNHQLTLPSAALLQLSMRHAFAQAKSSPFGRTMTTAGFFVASAWG